MGIVLIPVKFLLEFAGMVVVAIAALFISVAGPFISGGIDLINAGVYAKEGQNGMAALMTAVAFIPGGMQVIKAIKGKGLQKGVTTTLDWAVNLAFLLFLQPFQKTD